jgi:type II secretory pathway pseudopilin PulG
MLTEVMIAIVILGVVMATVTPIYLASTVSVRRSHNIELATQSAREQVELWRGRGYAALPEIGLLQTSTTRTFSGPASLPNATATAVFTRVDANQNPSLLDTGRCRLVVTVAWRGNGSNHGDVSLTTLITK